jgi:thiol-disulfide isomerase/thioredoxin
LILVLLILFTIVAYYGYTAYAKSQTNRFKDVANENRRKKEAVVLFFHADWCPHCQTAKPELEKLGTKQTIGGTTVRIQKLEEKDIPEAVKPNIRGYPTIQLLNPDGSVKADYEGERTTAGFLEFLKAQYS